MKTLKYLLSTLIVITFLFACSDDDVPVEENPEEIITDITLTFTPGDGSGVVTATATDADGEGPEDLEVISDIVLNANTTYSLEITLDNSVAGESVTEEIEGEDDEHLFLFSWTNDLFTNPTGDGNIDNIEDEAIVYLDEDEGGLPLGLETRWVAGDANQGTFRVVLKHQPDGIKTATSGINDGESEVNLTWNIEIM